MPTTAGNIVTVILVAWGLVICPSSIGQERAEFDWEAYVNRLFPSETAARLKEDKFVVVDEDLHQVFETLLSSSPQRGNHLPSFITSDAVLHAAVVLMDESLARMEGANATLISHTFQKALRNLPRTYAQLSDPSPFTEKARKLAQLFLAMPCHLLGGKVEDLDAEVAEWLKAESLRVETATEKCRPEWLSPSSHAEKSLFDYRSCRPVGSHTRSDLLRRHFKALRWLQMARLPTDQDENWLALWLIAESVFPPRDSDPNLGRTHELAKAMTHLSGLFGETDGESIFDPSNRIHLFTDKVTAQDILDKRRSTEGSLLLPARRLPDAVLFAQTAGGPGLESRALPCGLEIAAWLGSPLADAELRRTGLGEVATKIETLSCQRGGYNRYAEWLESLSALTQKVDPDAPEIFRSRAWQRKTAETLLASWAQMRRASVLQTKIDVNLLSNATRPSGLIEPNPVFFHRLADWCGETASDLDRQGVFSNNAATQSFEIETMSHSLREFAATAVLRTIPPDEGPPRDGTHIWHYVGGLLIEHDYLSSQSILHQTEKWEPAWKNLKIPEQLKAMTEALDQLNKELSEGKREALIDPFPQKLRRSWNELERVCRNLAMLGHKQLRGSDFSPEENYLIASMGGALATVEFYEGNSFLSPRDDAPKSAEVFRERNAPRHLIAATGRPLALYVLYPWKGKELLCRGGVMTYYEWVAGGPVTDQEWITKLDSKPSPERPSWTLPVQTRLPVKPAD